MVWGTTHMIPPFCFVVEVIAPGLLALKHRPRPRVAQVCQRRRARRRPDQDRGRARGGRHRLPRTPNLHAGIRRDDDEGRRVERAGTARAVDAPPPSRGILLLVPPGSDAWRQSIVHPIEYTVQPPFGELAALLAQHGGMVDREWTEATARAIDAVAGLTAVDGAAVLTNTYELLAFGAKITRRRGAAAVEQVTVTEPIEGNVAERMHPGQLGGTRHLSAAQFVHRPAGRRRPSSPRRTGDSPSSRRRRATRPCARIGWRYCCCSRTLDTLAPLTPLFVSDYQCDNVPSVPEGAARRRRGFKPALMS